MAVQIQLRRATASAWTAANTVLAEGEIGFESDTKYIKFGDGVTAWTSLTYSTVVGAVTTSTIVDSAVTTPKIADANVTSAKLATSISLTGVPLAPTASPGTDTTQLATTAFVAAASAVVAVTADAAIQEGFIAAKGDLIAGAANDTPAILTVGTDGYFLKADSVAATGLAWGALDLSTKADLASPTLTGVPAAPTATVGTSTTQLATTAFVATEVAALVDASPAALNTLNELALALGSDAAFSTTVTNSLALKAPIASPTFTGTVTIPTGASISGFALLASPTFTGVPDAPTATEGTKTTQVATTEFVGASLDSDQNILAMQIFS